jgi:NAD(P)H-binding
MRMLLNNIRYGLMDNKLKGEDLLRQSGAKYTIVRPGGLTNGPGGKEKLVIGAHFCFRGLCSSHDLIRLV